jgi:hypothetical protein
MANTYDQGVRTKLRTSIRNEANQLTNPSTVTIKLCDPDGIETIKTTPLDVSNPSTGVFDYSHVWSKPGIWYYRWISTGDPQHEKAAHAFVRRPDF